MFNHLPACNYMLCREVATTQCDPLELELELGLAGERRSHTQATDPVVDDDRRFVVAQVAHHVVVERAPVHVFGVKILRESCGE